MLDIRLIRDEPGEVRRRLAARGPGWEELVDEVLALDEVARRGETEKQALQGERNRLAKEIGKGRAAGEDTSAQEDAARKVGERISARERNQAANFKSLIASKSCTPPPTRLVV